MGTACIKSPIDQKPNQNNNSKGATIKNFPNFTANIRELHQQYVKHVLHVRNTKFFASKTNQLKNAVQRYFKNQFKYDKNDLNIGSIDSVRKLHPKQYWQGTITQQWLIDACLRQQKFSDQTKVQFIGFDHAFPAYVNFLRLCRYNFIHKNGDIAVPSKCQDVIWHSHMQDPQKYKADMMKLMGKLLNHMDDIPDQQLKKHSNRTKQLYKQLQNKPIVIQNTSKQQPNQNNINPIKT